MINTEVKPKENVYLLIYIYIYFFLGILPSFEDREGGRRFIGQEVQREDDEGAL